MEQTDLLKYAVETLERLGISYAIVGSFASGVWGESRFTQDIDILVRLPSQSVASLCAEFSAPDFYVSETAALEAAERHGQFNVIHPASGNKIDFMIAGRSDWTINQLARSIRIELFPGYHTNIAAPEDVIIGKLIYYREGGSDKHLRDIAGIMAISDSLIDRSYIEDSAIKLGVTDVWHAVLQRLKTSSP